MATQTDVPMPRFDSPLGLWIAIWQRQLINARG
jgi:hypothetical protein